MTEIILQNDPRFMELVRLCRRCEHLDRKDKDAGIWLTEEFPDGMCLICTNTLNHTPLHLDWKAGLLYDFENQRWHNKKICGKYTPRKTPFVYEPCCNCKEHLRCDQFFWKCTDRQMIAARIHRDGAPVERIGIKELVPSLPRSSLDDGQTPYKWWE